MTTVPRYSGAPASDRSSKAARGSSRKRDTRCEMLLRRALWRAGLRYRVSSKYLPGCPDIVFTKGRVAVFCDGDFWHGRNLLRRLSKLAEGHNSAYWTAKIQANSERDARNAEALCRRGWLVLRFWESDIIRDPEGIASSVAEAVGVRRRERL